MKLTLNKIKTFSQNFLLIFSITFILLLIHTANLPAEEKKIYRTDQISQLISDTSCILVYVNLEQFDIDEFFKKNFTNIDQTIKYFGFDSNSAKRITNELSRLLNDINVEFKSQLDKLKLTTNFREAYVIVQVGVIDKVKNTVQISFVLAIPSENRTDDDRKNLLEFVNAAAIPELISEFERSWAIGQYSGFDVIIAEIDYPLPQTAEKPTAIVVPQEKEIAQEDELIDTEELAVREKNLIKNFFSKNNKEFAELIKDAFSRHEKDAPIRVMCFNLKNLITVFDRVYIKSVITQQLTSIAGKENLSNFLQIVEKFEKCYENTKWISLIINPKSMMPEYIVQAKSDSDAKTLLETTLELNNKYYELYISAVSVSFNQNIETVLLNKNNSRFYPLGSEIIKGLTRPYLPVQKGNRLVFIQKNNAMYQSLCAYYCIIGYCVFVTLNN